MFFSAYSTDDDNKERNAAKTQEVPYKQWVILQGPNGENVRLNAVFDDGSMVGAIDSVIFAKVAHRLSPLKPSSRWLRMANGVRVQSDGVWEGRVTVGGIARRGAFEVFAGGGSWDMLFGKPLLRKFHAVHEYLTDTVAMSIGDVQVILPNLSKVDGASLGENPVAQVTESRASLKGLPGVRDPSRR
ncbi:hypothetical protein BDZ89DRAFT_945629, partial [Hymenopellis radicata]